MTKPDLDSVETFKCKLPFNGSIMHLMTELSNSNEKSYHVYVLNANREVFKCEYRKEKDKCSCKPTTTVRKIQSIKIGKILFNFI